LFTLFLYWSNSVPLTSLDEAPVKDFKASCSASY
jgi:hypothetical protein